MRRSKAYVFSILLKLREVSTCSYLLLVGVLSRSSFLISRKLSVRSPSWGSFMSHEEIYLVDFIPLHWPPAGRVPHFHMSARRTHDYWYSAKVALPYAFRGCFPPIDLETDPYTTPIDLICLFTLEMLFSTCVAFLAKHASFLTKCVAFYVKLVWLISLVTLPRVSLPGGHPGASSW